MNNIINDLLAVIKEDIEFGYTTEMIKNKIINGSYSYSDEHIGLLRDCWSAACASGYHNYPSLTKMQADFDEWLKQNGIESNETSLGQD